MTDTIQTDDMAPFFSRKVAMEMNLDFCRAMLAARRAGDERFSIGVIVDNTPFVPKHFEQCIKASGMSSAAALCSDDVTPGAARMVSGRFGPSR